MANIKKEYILIGILLRAGFRLFFLRYFVLCSFLIIYLKNSRS